MGEDLLTDEDLIRAVTAGDDRHYRTIVKRHQNTVYGIGMRFFRNPDDAADFTQEAFIRAYQNLGSYQGRSLFKYWLYRVAYNLALNKVKSGRDDVSLVDEAHESGERGIDECIASSEVRDLLMKAVAELPEQYRVCVDLYFFGDMSYPQISAVTDIPVNTIKSNVFRAKQLLRDSLKGTIAEDYHEV